MLAISHFSGKNDPATYTKFSNMQRLKEFLKVKKKLNSLQSVKYYYHM